MQQAKACKLSYFGIIPFESDLIISKKDIAIPIDFYILIR